MAENVAENADADKISDLSAQLLDAIPWPVHEGSLTIQHNEHRANYDTVSESVGDMHHNSADVIYHRDDFPDEAEIAKCIATDSVWTIQWYPRSPVSFARVHAATLSRALQLAMD